MKKKVMKEVEIEICDFCGKEVRHPEKCAYCGKVGCGPGWSKENDHWAYHLEIYRYSDEKRLAGYGSHICKECKDVVRVLDSIMEKVK
jgi:hypothetical protein